MILLWLIYPILEASVQGFLFKFKKGYKPNYLMLFCIRGMAAIVHAGLIMNVSIEPWYQWPLVLCFQLGSFWLLFDPLLNAYRNKRWDYEGKNSGWLKGVPYLIQALISILIILFSLHYLYIA